MVLRIWNRQCLRQPNSSVPRIRHLADARTSKSHSHIACQVFAFHRIYSDIGKGCYSRRGWPAFSVNNHIELDATPSPIQSYAYQIQAEDLLQLCQAHIGMARENMATLPAGKTRMMILPDIDHMMCVVGQYSWPHRGRCSSNASTNGNDS